MISIKKAKCTVLKEDITVDDIIKIQKNQKNSTENCTENSKTGSAFDSALKGSKCYTDFVNAKQHIFKNVTVYKYNYENKCDGLDLLSQINDSCIKTAFFDPQYRGVLDKLSYGNEGKGRGKARCELPQMEENTIKNFIQEIDRVLLPSGHLFLWVDKFHLCTGLSDWYKDTNLNLVDMIVWDKMKMGMGYRSRRISEYLIVLQKSPIRAKGVWTIHSIPDVFQEKVIKNHPHTKPVKLQQLLIEATTNEGDFVLDPASGGYSVFDACKKTNRNFIGCDITFGKE